MLIFDSSNWYELDSSTASEASEKLFPTEKQLLIRPDFTEFPDWLSESYSIVLDDSDLRDDAWQEDELPQLEEYQVHSQAVLMTCPKNMPHWQGAWWGEKALQEID
jgi:hypothetical protein